MTADSHFWYHFETLTAWQFFGGGGEKKKKEELEDKVVYWYLGLHCAEPLRYAEKRCILAGLRSLLILSISFGVLSLQVSGAVLL